MLEEFRALLRVDVTNRGRLGTARRPTNRLSNPRLISSPDFRRISVARLVSGQPSRQGRADSLESGFLVVGRLRRF
jgi:hypothetical protein